MHIPGTIGTSRVVATKIKFGPRVVHTVIGRAEKRWRTSPARGETLRVRKLEIPGFLSDRGHFGGHGLKVYSKASNPKRIRWSKGKKLDFDFSVTGLAVADRACTQPSPRRDSFPGDNTVSARAHFSHPPPTTASGGACEPSPPSLV